MELEHSNFLHKTVYSFGAKLKNIKMFDSKGLICKTRKDLSEEKKYFAIHESESTLEKEISGSDVL